MKKPKMPPRGRHRMRVRDRNALALAVARKTGGPHRNKPKHASRTACRGKVSIP